MTHRHVGVEEELLLVDAATGQARAVAAAVLQRARGRQDSGQPDSKQQGSSQPEGAVPADELELELQLEQLETATRPCQSLDELDREIRRCRSLAAAAAQQAGVHVAAIGTSPMAVEPSLTLKSRYQRMAAEFGLTAHEQLTCGCHVHVEVGSEDEGVAVLDRIRPWLPVLLALSANSPFWQERDSGYASYRYQAWGRWPSSGPTTEFGSAQAYHALADAMLATGIVLDLGMIYFDARLSRNYPTVEVRIADVCLDAADAVLVAALIRALVETQARGWRAGQPASGARTELVRLASWRASRSGLDGELTDPATFQPAPASAVAYSLLEHVRDALTETGEFGTVQALLADVLRRGNGARQQREVFRRDGRVLDVVRRAIASTSG